jgi:hypothetical protein
MIMINAVERHTSATTIVKRSCDSFEKSSQMYGVSMSPSFSRIVFR